jgi:hypothetical protein
MALPRNLMTTHKIRYLSLYRPLLAGWVLVSALSVMTSAAATAQDYREFRLGSTLAEVSAITKSSATDIKVTHQRPALLQTIEWRPRYTAGRTVPDTDPVREITFSFIDDKLFMIAASYEPRLVVGLTDADFIAAVSATYGQPMASPTRPRAADLSEPDAQVIAAWDEEEVQVRLIRTQFYGYRLVVSSTTLEIAARAATAAAVVTDRQEAPARDAARRTAEIAAARAADEKARDENKAGFTP